MRVLMIYMEPAPYIIDLIRVMRRQHLELQLRVLFISANRSQPWDSRLTDGVSMLLPEGKIAALKQILFEIRKGEFDWLHLAGWGHPLLMSALIIGAAFRRNISMESDSQLPIGQSRWKKWIKKLLYPWLFSLADALFPGGTRQKECFLHYSVTEKKIVVAQMTVDVAKIYRLSIDTKRHRHEIRASIGLSNSSIVYVFVGRLEIYKGINLLLDAFRSIDDIDIQLLIVGDGSCRAMVKKAVALDSRIYYVGRKDFSGVIESFAVSDVAVVPSSFEPWGLVVNEAMAAGLPVIASNRVGCVDDLVHHQRTGLIFSSNEVDILVSEMRKIASDELLRKRLACAGKELISKWRLENEAEIIVSTWQEAVGREQNN